METISEKVVEETWHEVASFTPDQANKRMTDLSKNQPDLVGFVVEFTKLLDQEEMQLAVYMLFTVFRMFQKSFLKKIKPISSKEIIQCYESNEDLMKSLEGVHEKFLDRIASIQISSQPYVMKYVVDALMEASEEEDPVELNEEDKGYLFLILKTVTDLLNKATDD